MVEKEKDNMMMREENKKLWKAGEAAKCKIDGLQHDIKNLNGVISKKDEKIKNSEKYNAKALKKHAESEATSREVLRKVQAESDARFKKQSDKIGNLQKAKNELKMNRNEINSPDRPSKHFMLQQ